MALVLVLDFCMESDDDGNYYLQAADETGEYDATDNPTGWGDASTLLPSNVTTATLTVTDPNGTETEFDVLSQIPDPVTGTFDFTAITSDDGVTISDGYYKMYYEVSDGSESYTACTEKYFYPNVRCCISDLVNRLRDDEDDQDLWDTVVKVKAWEQVLKSAAACVDTTTADKFLELLESYCDYNGCCKDC